MGTAQQVYCAIAGDFQGGPDSKRREDRGGTSRTAMNTFWGAGNGFTTQNKAVVILGDIVGADDNSATWLREQDVWGGGDETPAETFTCHGQNPALTARGSAEWCMDHPGGANSHTGYMNEAIRNVALPIPGNHDRYCRPGGTGTSQFRYDGYYTWWRDRYTSDTGTKLRPFNMGLQSGDPEAGPWYYYKDLPAPDGNSYWRVILVDSGLYIDATSSVAHSAADKTTFENWLRATLTDAATTGKHVICGWHEPPFLVNNGGDDYGFTKTSPITKILQTYTAGFMIQVCGHIHVYSRWNPMRYNTAFLHHQEPVSVSAFQNGAGAVLPLVIGTGGQTPGGFDSTAYWANVADATTGNCRPKVGIAGYRKAAVCASGSTGIGVLGEADAITDTATGQPGHPFGIGGFILDQNSFKIQFWGGRAPYGNTADVLKYDESQLYTWQGVTVPVPTITAISPTSGVIGTAVTITGTNFTGATDVAFAGHSAVFTVVDSTHISTAVPSGAVTGTISVTTPDGSASSSQQFTVQTTTVIAAWRSAELYGGGGINTVVFDPKGNRAVVGGDTSGMKRTVDGGINWGPGYGGQPDSTSATGQQVIATEWSRQSIFPDRVWAATATGLKVSTNAGLDWADCPVGPTFSQGTTRPRTVGHCLADDGLGRLYAIDNAGNVWRYSGIGAAGNTGTMTLIAALGAVGTSLEFYPNGSSDALLATTRSAMYLIENVQSGTTPTVRQFTGTGTPLRIEEVAATQDGAGNFLAFAAAYDEGVRRVTVPALGGTGVITAVWDVITPPGGGGQWSAVDAMLAAGNPIVVAGQANPVPIVNGYTQLFYTANGTGTPTWVCLTANDLNSSYSNQMGGSGGARWWGDGIRAGATARELSPNRWITGPGGVEQVAFDPITPNHILAVGEQGAYVFDTTLKQAYPSMVGLNGTTNMATTMAADTVFISDLYHAGFTSQTGGRGGDWYKNENGLATTTGVGMFGADWGGGILWAGYGSQVDNTLGDVYFHTDPTLGTAWTSTGFGSVGGGARPLGISAKRVNDPDGIQDTIIVLAAAQWIPGTTTFGGIYKRTYTLTDPPVAVDAWRRVSTSPMFVAPAAGYQRSIPLEWASETIAYCYDPSSGLWRTVDAGETWTNIWNATCNTDRQGFMQVDPDDPTTVYVSLGTAATSTNRGIWKLTGADINTVGSGIAKTAITKPGGVAFTNPGPIARASNGRVGFTETNGTNPSAYYSSDGGVTLVDETDPYFQRAARRMTDAAMNPDGRWFIATQGSGTIVWDNEASRIGDGTIAPVRRIVQYEQLSWVSGTSAASYNTASIAGTHGAGRLLIADVVNSHATAAGTPTALTGLGLTWTQVKTAFVTASDGTQRRITTYEAMTTAVATGALTVTYAAAQTGIAVHVEEYENVEATVAGGGQQTVAVTHLARTTPGTDTDQTAYTVGPFTPAANSVIGLVIGAVNTTASQIPTISSITDTAGRTYTSRATQAASVTNEHKLFFYTALAGGSPAATTITVTFTATMEGCNLEVLQFANADLTTPMLQKTSGNPLSAATPNFSLPVAPAASSIVVAVVAAARSPIGFTPEAGWTSQYSDASATPVNGMLVATRLGDQTFTATGTAFRHWWMILEFQGAANAVTDAVVQSKAITWGSTLSRPTITLDNPVDAAGNNAVHTASVTPRFPAAWEPEVGWTEIAELGYATPVVTGVEVASVISTTDNSFAASAGTDARWAATALEIRSLGAGVSQYTKSFTMDYILGGGGTLSHTTDFYVISPTVSSNIADFSDLAQVVDTATVTVAIGDFVAVENSTNTGIAPVLPTVSGTTGVTWALVSTIVYGVSGTLRRRLSLFQASSGTPVAGYIRFSATDCAVTWAWSVVGMPSGGSLVRPWPAVSAATNTISVSVTPTNAAATLLAFAAKKGVELFVAGSGMEILTQTVNDPPGGALMSEMGATISPKVVSASSAELTEMGMVVLELSGIVLSGGAVVHDTDYITARIVSTSEVSHDTDYVVAAPQAGGGTVYHDTDYVVGTIIIQPPPTAVPTEPAKRRGLRRTLSRVFVTIAGEEVPVEDDYQFSETALGGYDLANFSVPAKVARARRDAIAQDAPVAIWDGGGVQLWGGRVERPPAFKDNLAKVDANGFQYDARRATGRLMYQIAGTDGWADMDADPYGYDTQKGYETDVTPGRLAIRRAGGETFADGDKDGFVFWTPGAHIRRLSFRVRKTANMPNFDLSVRAAVGPSGNWVQVNDWSLNATGVQDKDDLSPRVDAGYDQVLVFLRCNANNTQTTGAEHVWLTDVRVNGIAWKGADYDVFTTSDVAMDIARRVGWDVSDVGTEDFNALPIDFNDQDWGEALDYVSVLDNTAWQVYEGPTMRRRAWDHDTVEVAQEDGATLDLSAEPVYDIVRVVYTQTGGRQREVVLQQGNGRELPPVEMSDTQRTNRPAESLAERLMREYGSIRYSGNVEVVSGSRAQHAGRTLTVVDWDAGDSLPLQVADITQTVDRITYGIRSPQIASRFIARLEKKRGRGQV